MSYTHEGLSEARARSVRQLATAPAPVTPLQTRILAAHEKFARTGSAADHKVLTRLQEQYRLSGPFMNSKDRGHRSGPVGLKATGDDSPSVRSGSTATTSYSPAIIIDDSAWRALDADHFEGTERGGYLFGPVDEPDVITMAVLADQDDRDSHNVRLDRARAHEIWESLPSDMTIRGSWHQHPPGTHAEPSSTDLQSARGAAEAYKRPWIELVIHDAPTSVMGLDGRLRETSSFEISATVVRADGSQFRTEVTRR